VGSRAPDVLHQLVDRDVWVADQASRAADHLAEVVRRDGGRQSRRIPALPFTRRVGNRGRVGRAAPGASRRSWGSILGRFPLSGDPTASSPATFPIRTSCTASPRPSRRPPNRSFPARRSGGTGARSPCTHAHEGVVDRVVAVRVVFAGSRRRRCGRTSLRLPVLRSPASCMRRGCGAGTGLKGRSPHVGEGRRPTITLHRVIEVASSQSRPGSRGAVAWLLEQVHGVVGCSFGCGGSTPGPEPPPTTSL